MNLIQVKLYFDEVTNKIVTRHQRSGGFGSKGKSAAVRNIILEWNDLTRYRLTEEGQQVLDEERKPQGE
jgi:hypothetical protein